jgi:1-acyl-sn-glycerol-3-phosphate acyltransferase
MSIIKQIIFLIIIIIISNILILIYSIRKGLKDLILYINNLANIKIKTINSKNLNNFTKDRIIIMANHMNGIDYLPISQLFNNLNKNKKLYTVVTSTLFNCEQNKNILTNTMNYFGDSLFNYCNFIKYVKCNKDSGLEVRKKIVEEINNNNTVLIFPEGIVTPKGIPESFKPGSFEICKENSISILPITITYNKNLGVNSDENGKFMEWFNTDATLYIHDIINHDDCIDSNDMMQKTLNAIREPLIN